jgi:phosphate transport system ATP-binding protein
MTPLFRKKNVPMPDTPPDTLAERLRRRSPSVDPAHDVPFERVFGRAAKAPVETHGLGPGKPIEARQIRLQPTAQSGPAEPVVEAASAEVSEATEEAESAQVADEEPVLPDLQVDEAEPAEVGQPVAEADEQVEHPGDPTEVRIVHEVHSVPARQDPFWKRATRPVSARITQLRTPPGPRRTPAHIKTAATAVLEPPPMPQLASLEARNISAWFGERLVLDRVSLTMPAGVVTSLIGPSGCGKSTFLRILNRMHELVPSASLAGEVLIDGDDIYDPDRKLVEARKSIGMVFQKPNPFPAMSIYDNVIAGLGLTGTRVDRDRRDELVETSLRRAGLWTEVKDRLRAPGGGLSGGQQQRLCIARALAVTPRVLLMDEPCSALDPTSTRVIEETMLELVHDVSIVIVTHNMQQAQRVSTQCAFFLASQGQPGAIVEHGDTASMFGEPIDSRTFDYVNGRFG